jgi:hypothetical protein
MRSILLDMQAMPATMLSPGFVKPCKTMQKVDDWRELASVMAHYRLPLEGVATFEELKEKTNAWETLLPTFCHNRGTEDFLDFAATIDAFLGAWQCWDQGTSKSIQTSQGKPLQSLVLITRCTDGLLVQTLK